MRKNEFNSYKEKHDNERNDFKCPVWNYSTSYTGGKYLSSFLSQKQDRSSWKRHSYRKILLHLQFNTFYKIILIGWMNHQMCWGKKLANFKTCLKLTQTREMKYSSNFRAICQKWMDIAYLVKHKVCWTTIRHSTEKFVTWWQK